MPRQQTLQRERKVCCCDLTAACAAGLQLVPCVLGSHTCSLLTAPPQFVPATAGRSGKRKPGVASGAGRGRGRGAGGAAGGAQGRGGRGSRGSDSEEEEAVLEGMEESEEEEEMQVCCLHAQMPVVR